MYKLIYAPSSFFKIMSKTVITAIISKLKASSALTTILGASGNISVSHIAELNKFPALTITQNTESSKKRVGYVASPTRDQYPVIQLDCWSKKSTQQTYEIADVVDKICVSDSVSNTTFGWQKVSDSDQFEPDTHVFHKALRFSFQYAITDS